MPFYDTDGEPRAVRGALELLRSAIVTEGQLQVQASDAVHPCKGILSVPSFTEAVRAGLDDGGPSSVFDEADLCYGYQLDGLPYMGYFRVYEVRRLWLVALGGYQSEVDFGLCGAVGAGAQAVGDYGATIGETTAGQPPYAIVDLPCQVSVSSSPVDPCGVGGDVYQQNIPLLYIATVSLPPVLGYVQGMSPEWAVGIASWYPADEQGLAAALEASGAPPVWRFDMQSGLTPDAGSALFTPRERR